MNTQKPRRNPQYRLEAIDGELLLFNPMSTQIIYCNQTASMIWQLCDGVRAVQEIVDLLAGAFPETADTVARDVRETLEHFAQHGAIDLV